MKCELPYEIGTFVRAKSKIDGVQILGTVAAYELYDDGYMIWVSGYRESIYGVFLPEDVVPLTCEEIYELKKRRSTWTKGYRRSLAKMTRKKYIKLLMGRRIPTKRSRADEAGRNRGANEQWMNLGVKNTLVPAKNTDAIYAKKQLKRA